MVIVDSRGTLPEKTKSPEWAAFISEVCKASK
jgi:hypothetical protein